MSNPVSATIVATHPETERLLSLTLAVDDAVRAAYTRPGQVIVVHPEPGQNLYLAIASKVGDEHLRVLLGEGARRQIGPEPGRVLSITPPTGRGFPVEMADGNNVLLFAVGSALAPIRPLIEHFRAQRSNYGRIVLYVGAHTDQDFPFAGEFDAWRRDRIDIVKSISKPWVQERFSADRPSLDDTVAYVCGMKAMMQDVERVLVNAGLPADRIGKNW